MELNMYIIADHLGPYDVIPNITDGSGVIMGILLSFAKVARPAPEYLYIGMACEMFPGLTCPGPGAALAHNKDTILAVNQSVETVLNDTLALFEYYNKWEAEISSVKPALDAVQKIITLSEKILAGPTTVIDRFGKMLGLSECYEPAGYGEDWQAIYNTRSIPLSILSRPVLDLNGNLVNDWSHIPGIYHYENGKRFIAAHILKDGEPILAINIREAGKIFNSGDLKIASVLCETLSVLYQKDMYHTILSGKSLLINILEKNPLDETVFEKYAGSAQIPKPWRIISIRSISMAARALRGTE